MKAKFNVLVERDEDGYYVATVPSLPGCHTYPDEEPGRSHQTGERGHRIELYLEEKEIVPGEFVGVQIVEAETG